MPKTIKAFFTVAAMMNFWFCNGSSIDPAVCVEVESNSTIQRIGYDSMNSMLSLSFTNELSHCTPDLPQQSNRLDISLQDLQCAYSNKKTDNPEIFPLPQGSSILFDGAIACTDSCVIAVPIDLHNTAIRYIHKKSGDIVIAIDTNATPAREFKIWNYQ